MNIRTAAILTTEAMLIVTLAVPIFANCMLKAYRVNEMGMANVIPLVPVYWLINCSPLIISCLIAKRLQFDVPAVILFASTIVYVSLFLFMLYLTFFTTSQYSFLFFLVGIVTLPVMLPAWIAALMLNTHNSRNEGGTPP